MKNQNFVVEILENDGDRKYIIRQMNGQPVKIVSSSDELATFFNDFQFAN